MALAGCEGYQWSVGQERVWRGEKERKMKTAAATTKRDLTVGQY
jgi:hypothetical protein